MVLHHLGCHGVQTRFRATAGLVRFVIGSVAGHLTNGTSRAPKGAAAVFTTLAALFRNLVLLSNMRPRAHHDYENENRIQERQGFADRIQVECPRGSVFRQGVHACRFIVFGRGYIGVSDVVNGHINGIVHNKGEEHDLEGRHQRLAAIQRRP